MLFFHKLRRNSSRRNSNSRRVSIETLETRDLLSAVLPDDPFDDPVADCPQIPSFQCLDAYQPSHSDDSLHHDDDTDADDDQWLGPDDNDLPEGAGFILDGERDFSGTRGDHLEVAHDENLELKEGASAF